MLALDFDGVVCDGLGECAAITWHASRQTSETGEVQKALAQVPEAFLTTFAGVRRYSRTLDDFMVANALVPGQRIDRQAFDLARTTAGSAALAAQAAVGEQIRAAWRTQDTTGWVALHSIYPGMAELIRSGGQRVVIVSAKDADSIWAILEHHTLATHVDTVVGSCHDKTRALSALSTRHDEMIFVDDNLSNAAGAAALLGITSRWATWGYHSPEDEPVARQLGIRAIALNQLDELQPQYGVLTPA
ncbi:MAG: HAD family hydrolase [Mycobacteriales bacterium]